MSLFAARSRIHGKGCFTKKSLRAGTEFNVPSYHTGVATDHSITWNDDGDWYELYSPFRFINHSEKPNAEFYLADDGTWNLYILRAVRANGEITIHYGNGWSSEGRD